MAPHTINVVLTTFPGLGLPRSLNLQVPSDCTVADVERVIAARLPPEVTNLNLTTTSNKILSSRRNAPVTTLLDTEEDNFLPLRLSAGLCGGKGGFGSQLRAAGGRLGKRKNDRNKDHSSRLLGGKRVHVTKEVEALAEYLAIKPEMDRREKEERRQRLQDIIESTEAKKASILNPKSRLDGEWLEAKDEMSEKTRQDVLAALKAGNFKDVLGEWSSGNTSSDSDDDASASDEGVDEAPEEAAQSKNAKQATSMKFFGWDEDDLSDSENEESAGEERTEPQKDVPMTEEQVTTSTRTTRSKRKATT